MASRKSSILKPRKAREPLQDLNQLIPNNDDEETTITTGLAKRRVSFASMNKVKEFESAAECLTLLNTPAYDERFSMSSDSCQSSVLGSSHTAPKESFLREDTAVEEEIELTETVGGRILESSMKSRIDSSMEFTTPHPVNQPEAVSLYETTNQSKFDADTSCMETTEVIANNVFSESVFSQVCQDTDYEEVGTMFECQNMEISPFREAMPLSRKSIFHRDQDIPTRKSIFDIPTPQPPRLDETKMTNDESVLMDMSIPPEEENEENLPPRVSIVPNAAKRSIFDQSINASNMERQWQMPWNINFETRKPRPASDQETADAIVSHNLSLPVLSQTSRSYSAPHNSSMQPLTNRTHYHDSSMQLVSQNIEARIETKIDEHLIVVDDSSTQSACQNVNKTRYSNSNMQLASQELNAVADSPNDNKTRYDNSVMQLASQERNTIIESEIDNKTRLNNSNMQLASQETNGENKTQFNNTNMQLVSQETIAVTETPVDDKTYFDNSNVQFMTESRLDDKTHFDNSNMQLTKQNINEMTESRTDDQTRFNNSNMQFVSQEMSAVIGPQMVLLKETEYVDSTTPLIECHDSMTETTQTATANEDKTHYEASTVQLTSPNLADCSSVDEMVMVEKSTGEAAEIEEQEPNTSGKLVAVDEREISSDKVDVNETKSEIQKSFTDNNSSSATSDSNSPLTVGVNFSIFQKNKETRVEFSGTIDSNKKERSKSISNVQVNIINNKAKNEDRNVQKLRFSMPATKSKYDETKPRVYASFVDVSVSEDKDVSKRNTFNVDADLESIKLMSPILENESLGSQEKVEQDATGNIEPTSSKKRLSSEMLVGENELEATTSKRRSISTLRSCELMKEVTIRNEEDFSPDENASSRVENVDVREVCTSTEVRQRRESIKYEDQSSMVAIEKVIVETCSKMQTLTCTTSTNENVETNTALSPVAPYIEENSEQSRSFVKDLPEDNAPTSENHVDETAVKPANIDVEKNARKSVVILRADEECDDETTNVNENKSVAAVANVSSKVSLSDNEPSTKDRSVELGSDSESQRWSSQVQSTPRRKRSVKSLGSQSVLEDDLIDSLNNPSIIVNIGDSFSHRSLDLCSANVSIAENRDPSNLKEGSKDIESIPADNVSKVSFVSDWLQNKTGHKIESKNLDKKNGFFENHSSSSANSNKMLMYEKSASNTENSNKESAGVESAPCENRVEEAENLSEEVTKADTSTTLQTVPDIIPSSDTNADIVPVAADNELSSNELTPVCSQVDLVDGEGTSCVPHSSTHFPADDANYSICANTSVPNQCAEDDKKEPNSPNSEENAASINQAVAGSDIMRDVQSNANTPTKDAAEDEMMITSQTLDCPNIASPRLSTDNGTELDEELSVQRDENLIQSETANKVDGIQSSEIDCVDRDEEIDLDLMDVSGDHMDPDDGNQSVSRIDTSTDGMLRNEMTVESMKNEILRKIRNEFLSGNSEWRLTTSTCDEWTFQVSDRGLLGLIIRVSPATIECSASFKFVSKPPEELYEIMEIGIRALRHRCQKKIENICRTIEDLPFLLKSVTVDVDWMKGFVQDLANIAPWEDVRFKKGKASFSIASYKNLILFHVQVPLTNLRTLSVNDINVEVQYGNIDINHVRKMFSECGRDYNFFSAFVKQLTHTFIG